MIGRLVGSKGSIIIVAFTCGTLFVTTGAASAILSRILVLVDDPFAAAVAGFLVAVIALFLWLGTWTPKEIASRRTVVLDPAGGLDRIVEAIRLRYDSRHSMSGNVRSSSDPLSVDVERAMLGSYLREPGAMPEWEVVDAVTMAMRTHAATGSTRDLEAVGRVMAKVADDVRNGNPKVVPVDELVRLVEDMQERVPVADLPLSRHRNPRVALLRAHAEIVGRSGRPVPVHAIRWVKGYGPELYYGFLNAGRRHLGTYYPEGMAAFLEYRFDGDQVAIDRIVEEILNSDEVTRILGRRIP